MIRTLLERTVIVLVGLLAVLYAGDWAVHRYRVSHGTAIDTVQVSMMTAVPLKNGKYEFDYAGTGPVECVRSIFPWDNDDPCWWVRRHPEKMEKP